MKDAQVNQHKRMAMGDKSVGFAKGGRIAAPRVLKTGIPDSPVENAKRANGIVGMKKGGKC